MDVQTFADRVSSVAALAEPIRRELYLFVASRPEPVSRDQASEAVGAPRHTAKFHLDKLVDEGLLEVEFKRLSGRRGPGAGRPTKLYRRSARQIEVTLPERRYEIAGLLMARAIDLARQNGTDTLGALREAAVDLGMTLGDRARQAEGADLSTAQLLNIVCATLAAEGYEPRLADDAIALANCPFDALAREHTELVCGMNFALLEAVAGRIGHGRLTAELDPAPGRCCVVLAANC